MASTTTTRAWVETLIAPHSAALEDFLKRIEDRPTATPAAASDLPQSTHVPSENAASRRSASSRGDASPRLSASTSGCSARAVLRAQYSLRDDGRGNPNPFSAEALDRGSFREMLAARTSLRETAKHLLERGHILPLSVASHIGSFEAHLDPMENFVSERQQWMHHRWKHNLDCTPAQSLTYACEEEEEFDAAAVEVAMASRATRAALLADHLDRALDNTKGTTPAVDLLASAQDGSGGRIALRQNWPLPLDDGSEEPPLVTYCGVCGAYVGSLAPVETSRCVRCGLGGGIGGGIEREGRRGAPYQKEACGETYSYGGSSRGPWNGLGRARQLVGFPKMYELGDASDRRRVNADVQWGVASPGAGPEQLSATSLHTRGRGGHRQLSL